jgi:hypothetical protein
MRICGIYHIGDVRKGESKGLNNAGGARLPGVMLGVGCTDRERGFMIRVRAPRTVMLPFSSYGIASRVSFGAVAPELLPLKSVWTSSEG